MKINKLNFLQNDYLAGKHGTYTLSAAILANLALGYSLVDLPNSQEYMISSKRWRSF